MATLEFKGIDELMKRLDPQRTEADVRKVVKDNGADLQEAMQRRAPVAAYMGGTLRRSITIEIKDRGLTAVVQPNTDYASYVEYGTRFMSAQPYIRPSFMYQRYQFIRDLQKLMR